MPPCRASDPVVVLMLNVQTNIEKHLEVLGKWTKAIFSNH